MCILDLGQMDAQSVYVTPENDVLSQTPMQIVYSIVITYYFTYKRKRAYSDRPMLTDGYLIHAVSLLQTTTTRIMANAFNGAKEFYYTNWHFNIQQVRLERSQNLLP